MGGVRHHRPPRQRGPVRRNGRLLRAHADRGRHRSCLRGLGAAHGSLPRRRSARPGPRPRRSSAGSRPNHQQRGRHRRAAPRPGDQVAQGRRRTTAAGPHRRTLPTGHRRHRPRHGAGVAGSPRVDRTTRQSTYLGRARTTATVDPKPRSTARRSGTSRGLAEDDSTPWPPIASAGRSMRERSWAKEPRSHEQACLGEQRHPQQDRLVHLGHRRRRPARPVRARQVPRRDPAVHRAAAARQRPGTDQEGPS